MTAVGIDSVSVYGPGLEGWDHSRAVLTGKSAYHSKPLELRYPDIIPPRERRRCSPSVGLALLAAEAAARGTKTPVQDLPAVFGSSNGEGLVTHKLLESVTGPQPFASPTQFHNSVHNAAAGYWSISVGTHAPCTSVAAFDTTFGAALMKGVAQVRAERRPVLVTVFDDVLPPPLDACRHLIGPFAMALVLVPDTASSCTASLGMTYSAEAELPLTVPADPGLKSLWEGNPAARGIPLLQAISARRAETIVMAGSGSSVLLLDVTPCPQ